MSEDITVLRRFDKEALGPQRVPRRTFGAVIALSVVIVACEIAAGVAVFQGTEQAALLQRGPAEVAGRLRASDAAATSAVRLGALSADPAWEARYREDDAVRSAALKDAVGTSDTKSAKEAEAARAELAKLEGTAFVLARTGHRDEATGLVTGPGYASQRTRFEGAASAVLTAHQARVDAEVSSVARRASASFAFAVLLLGLLAACWWRLLRRLRDSASENVQEILRQTKERLELHVKERARALDGKNREMRLVLDNVSQGLLILDEFGIVGAQRSAIVTTWFGRRLTGMTYWDFVASVDAEASSMCQLAWEQLKSDVLPIEVALELLPKRILVGQTTLEVDYRPIMTRGALDHLLVVMSDATSRIERERLEGQQRELMAIFDHVVKDRTGVIAFFSEAKDLVAQITSKATSGADRRRYIHTLKGIAGMFGAASLATACHRIEDRVAEEGGDPTELDCAAIAEGWRSLAEKLEALVDREGRREIAIDEGEYAVVMRSLLEGAPRQEIVTTMARWNLEPVRTRFARFAERARGIALKVGKPELVVHEEASNLRLSSERWAPFWSSFVHVVSNAVDHGIESPDERMLAGKSKGGTIHLRAEKTPTELVIELADDGRGIDWEALVKRARARGLPASTRSEIVETLFADGVTTRDVASEISGRGAGLAAVREECHRLGGSVDVTSERGKGTRFVFRFPVQLAMSHLANAA